MNIKIYIRNFDGTWGLEKESDKKVISITVVNGNYVLVSEQEDYFGKLAFLYGMSKYKIGALPQ